MPTKFDSIKSSTYAPSLPAENSKATFNAYRRELERVLQWSWHVRKTNAYSLTRDDIPVYIKFVQNPPQTCDEGRGKLLVKIEQLEEEVKDSLDESKDALAKEQKEHHGSRAIFDTNNKNKDAEIKRLIDLVGILTSKENTNSPFET